MDAPPRPASLPPGYDEEDPYAGQNLDEYPDWWRRNILEFREYGMRPYRPAQFSDGALAPLLVNEIEDRWGTEIRFCSVDPHWSEQWEIQVNGKSVCRVKRERVGEGYSMYEIDSNEFVRLVQATDPTESESFGHTP